MTTPHEIANYLTGTCTTLNEALTVHNAEHLESNDKFCSQLDAMVFCCEACGYWRDVGEMSDNVEYYCDECEPDDEG